MVKKEIIVNVTLIDWISWIINFQAKLIILFNIYKYITIYLNVVKICIQDRSYNAPFKMWSMWCGEKFGPSGVCGHGGKSETLRGHLWSYFYTTLNIHTLATNSQALRQLCKRYDVEKIFIKNIDVLKLLIALLLTTAGCAERWAVWAAVCAAQLRPGRGGQSSYSAGCGSARLLRAGPPATTRHIAGPGPGPGTRPASLS